LGKGNFFQKDSVAHMALGERFLGNLVKQSSSDPLVGASTVCPNHFVFYCNWST